MSIASEIRRLASDSAAIAAAIAAKGVTVPFGSGYDDYASLIASIQAGKLPAGYTELQYVTTDSTAYLDTGISGTNDLDIVCAFMVTKYVQYGAIYGNYVDDNSKACRLVLRNTTQFYVGGGNNLSQAVNGYSLNTDFLADVTSKDAYINGTRTAVSAASSLASNTNNICLGNRSLTNPTTRDIGLRVKSFSVRRAGTLLLDLVACKNANDVAGFYDLVAKAFVPSGTSTPFGAGPSI